MSTLPGTNSSLIIVTISFPAVNSEGNTIDLRSLSASSPLSVPQDPLNIETSSVGASQLSAEPSPSPRFINLDAEDTTELPTSLDNALQPVLPDEVRGILATLQEEWVAVIGQYIGIAAPSGEECARCRHNIGCFASCRVVAFRESSVKSTVVSLGSYIYCHFAEFQFPAVTPTHKSPAQPPT
ncbi:hypothetical protein N7449_003916 [Penicillium cf. viridicatum]|uniref:Uncharacterized protein n=1 Tax=Penicillium cf. viridicatum TaxID=2972119 RepID=A0A9W9T4U1_9EURO|nr:hypothetical protein N7449_003916 [Penicillium cf. viridicatum]